MYSDGQGGQGGFGGYGEQGQGQGGRGGGRGGGRPCKFGSDCHKFREGTCTFLHDNNEGFGGRQQGGNGGNWGDQNGRGGGRGGRGGRGGPNNNNPNFNNKNNFNNNFQNNNYNNNNNHNNNFNNNNNNNNNDFNNGFKPNNNNNNNFQNNNGNLNFCKFFQQSECQKPNCKNPHQFTQGDTLRRVMKMKDVPNNPVSRLTTLLINGADYFALRQGNQVSVFQYFSETAQLKPLPNTIQLEHPDMHFYATKEQYIYYAYENKNTSYTNIGYLDVVNNLKVGVENAHKLKVTGLVHIVDPNNNVILLSSSLDGTIKVWKIEGDKLVLNKQLSDGINGCFKTNANLQVLFLVKETLAGNQILSAGTSDGRLLFWIGAQLNFKQVVFQEQFKKVLSIKYLKVQQGWIAMAIAWGADNKTSALIAVDLQTMQYQIIDRQDSGQQRQLHKCMETIGSLFLVSNFTGFVSIYKTNNFTNKIGYIMHLNEVCDMVSATSMTSTNIQMFNLFILEQFVNNDRQGSFQVYSQIQ